MTTQAETQARYRRRLADRQKRMREALEDILHVSSGCLGEAMREIEDYARNALHGVA